MRMQEAMAALNGGQTVDVTQLGTQHRAPAGRDSDGTSVQQRVERQVSLG
jgi:hypothetical protein